MLLADAALARLVPRFLAARKWRNRLLSPLIGLLGAAASASSTST